MRLLLTAIFTLACTAALHAEEAALVVANEDYEQTARLPGVDEVTRAAEALGDIGIDPVILRDADLDDLTQALRQIDQQSRQAEAMLVVLAGRFVFSDAESWFLPVEAEGESLVDTALSTIPLSTVMSVMSRVEGRSVLMLVTDLEDRRRIDGGLLRRGIGTFEVPEGVTVIRSQVGVAADIVQNTLARPGASIKARVQDDTRAWVQGEAGQDMAFLPADRTPPPAQPRGVGVEEQAIWDRARNLNTEVGYGLYLDVYPEGAFVEEAVRRLAAIREEPNRDARIAEDGLQLGRNARQEIQRDLVMLDYDTRGIDGVFGPGTRSAISNWQDANDLPRTGYLTARQVTLLDDQAGMRAATLESQRQERLAAERAFWQETGAGRDEDGLRRFLEAYPDGVLAEEATASLTRLRAARGDDDQAELRERIAWNRARSADTVAAYNEYLNAYPEGPDAANARARLDRLGATPAGGNDRAESVEAQLGLSQITRQAVEQRLAAEGLDPGRVDGQFDDRTRRAIGRYQTQAQLPATGYLDQITVVRLLADTLRRVLQ